MPPTIQRAPIVESETPAKEYKIPAALLCVAVAIYLAIALFRNGIAGLAAMSISLPITLIFQVVFGIVACFITAKIMSTDFGYITSAVVKLAAVCTFPGAVTFFIPKIGWLIALVIYYGLLEWLFDLEIMEAAVLVVVIFFVNIGALILVASIGLSMAPA